MSTKIFFLFSIFSVIHRVRSPFGDIELTRNVHFKLLRVQKSRKICVFSTAQNSRVQDHVNSRCYPMAIILYVVQIDISPDQLLVIVVQSLTDIIIIAAIFVSKIL